MLAACRRWWQRYLKTIEVNTSRAPVSRSGQYHISSYTVVTGRVFQVTLHLILLFRATHTAQIGVSRQAVAAFESALAERAEVGLVDMDEHLDDVTKDWRNPGIAAVS